ncbi:unnamed protein product [Alopecurus aequalis]
MASNGGSPYRWPPPAFPRPPLLQENYPCPFCGKTWSTTQALGGHMSKGYCRQPPRQPLRPLAATPSTDFLAAAGSQPRLLEGDRREGQTMVEIDFLGLLRAPAPPDAMVNDNVPEPSNNAAAEPQVNDRTGEDADGSVSTLDLTLRL